MTSASRPGGPVLDFALAGATLGVALLAMPLGLDRVAAGPLVSAGLTLEPAVQEGAGQPLALLLVRLFAWLPLGDLATRANLASAVVAALAALLLARLAAEVLVQLRPAADAPLESRELWHEPVAAGAGAAVAVLSYGVFVALTSASPAAVSLLLAAAVWIRALRVSRAPDRTADGLWLSFLAGLALGADRALPLFLWPIAALLWFWALRRGERWPLLGPLLGTAGAGVALMAVAAAETTVPLGEFAAALSRATWEVSAPLSAAGLWQAFSEAGAQIGVVAALAGGVGTVVLALRAPFACALMLVSVATGLLLAAGESRSGLQVAEGAASWALLIAAAVIPVGAGIAQMASKLGSARVAAAAVIAVIAAVWPALDGGSRRWRREARRPEQSLAEALAPLAPRARVAPASAVTHGLFRYGSAVGLRPDLDIAPR